MSSKMEGDFAEGWFDWHSKLIFSTFSVSADTFVQIRKIRSLSELINEAEETYPINQVSMELELSQVI